MTFPSHRESATSGRRPWSRLVLSAADEVTCVVDADAGGDSSCPAGLLTAGSSFRLGAGQETALLQPSPGLPSQADVSGSRRQSVEAAPTPCAPCRRGAKVVPEPLQLIHSRWAKRPIRLGEKERQGEHVTGCAKFEAARPDWPSASTNDVLRDLLRP
jgi:hypothetical protein